MSKNAVITGVSTGIGEELANVLVSRGYKVFGSVRKEEDAKELSDKYGDQFVPLIFDVTDDSAIEKAGELVRGILGNDSLDLLVNNAGIAVSGPMLHLPLENLKHQFDVNVFGLVKVTQVFAPLLGARPDFAGSPGRIVMISSVSGKLGMPFIGAYSGSKFAVEGISESLRKELMLYGIPVVVIGPGAVKTPIWDKGMSADLDQYNETPYGRSIGKFAKGFVKGAIKTALSAPDLATRIADVAELPNPAQRYTMMNRKFTNWVLPQLLPKKMVDRTIAKAIGLISRK